MAPMVDGSLSGRLQPQSSDDFHAQAHRPRHRRSARTGERQELQSSLTAAETLFNQKKWDEAIAAYRSILSSAPPLHVVHLQIAAAYLGKQDYERAAAAYNDLLKVEPSNGKAAVGLAAIKSAAGRHEGRRGGVDSRGAGTRDRPRGVIRPGRHDG